MRSLSTAASLVASTALAVGLLSAPTASAQVSAGSLGSSGTGEAGAQGSSGDSGSISPERILHLLAGLQGDTVSAPLSQIEDTLGDDLNAVRARAGLRPLRKDSSLTASARDWARTIAMTGDYKHDPDKPADQGENVAAQVGSTVYATVTDAWTNSPGHYRHMVHPTVKSYGIGIYKLGNLHYVVLRTSFRP